MNRYILYAAEVEKKEGGGVDLFSITFCMCGYPFVFTIILNKMKRDKEFVKCISVKSSMGNSNPCIYLLKGIESTHSQVQAIPFYGDIQLSLYMGIFLKIDTLQPMEKVQILPFLCMRAKPQRVT